VSGGQFPRVAYSVAEAAAVLGIGRSLAYEMVGRGELRSFTIGRRRLVSADAIAELVAELESQQYG
jgi:excisionase family DNA binding protein